MRRSPRRLAPLLWLVAVLSGALVLSPALAAPGGVVTAFAHASIDLPSGITSGPDGNLWFTNYGNDSIGRLTPSGTVTTFTHPSINMPEAITAGSDGNLWFTNASSIGRITPTGTVTNFTHPTIFGPTSITPGPDGRLWFTNFANSSIGRITTTGTVTNYTHATIDGPYGITAGPDGALWFTNLSGNSIGRITTSGTVTNYTHPSIESPWGITQGSDGALWFTNYFSGDSIGRITTTGTVTNYTHPSIRDPQGITAGPDGNLWFANFANDSIGRITTGGLVTQYTDATLSGPHRIAAGPDGNFWFTNSEGDTIGRITPSRCGPPPASGPFTDVGGRHPFCDDIEWSARVGVTTGLVDGSYRPGSVVTRQSMAAFLYRYEGAPRGPNPSCAVAPFTDVPVTHPFCGEIDWAADEGVVNGYDDGTYRPAAAITRGSTAALLYRLAGSPPSTPPATPTFPDVPKTHPFRKAIEWMAAEDITRGYDDGTFRPGSAVLRETMAAFLHRYDAR